MLRLKGLMCKCEETIKGNIPFVRRNQIRLTLEGKIHFLAFFGQAFWVRVKEKNIQLFRLIFCIEHKKFREGQKLDIFVTNPSARDILFF